LCGQYRSDIAILRVRDNGGSIVDRERDRSNWRILSGPSTMALRNLLSRLRDLSRDAAKPCSERVHRMTECIAGLLELLLPLEPRLNLLELVDSGLDFVQVVERPHINGNH